MAELSSISLVKSQLGISVTTWDTELLAILNSAETMIADWCDRRDNSAGMLGTESRWVSAAHTENLPGALQASVGLRFWPVTAITSVTVVGSSISSVALNSTTYRIDSDQRTLRMLGSYQDAWLVGLMDHPPPAAPNIAYQINTNNAYPYTAIVYTGGFNSSAIPTSLSQAAIELTSRMFQKRKRDSSLTGEGIGNYHWTSAGPGAWQEYKDEFCATYLSAYAGIGGGVC